MVEEMDDNTSEIISRREKHIDDGSLKILVKEAVKECLSNNTQTNNYDDVVGLESKLDKLILSSEQDSKDILKNSKQILQLTEKVTQLEQDSIRKKIAIDNIEGRDLIIKEAKEKEDKAKGEHGTRRTDIWLSILPIIISLIAVVLVVINLLIKT